MFDPDQHLRFYFLLTQLLNFFMEFVCYMGLLSSVWFVKRYQFPCLILLVSHNSYLLWTTSLSLGDDSHMGFVISMVLRNTQSQRSYLYKLSQLSLKFEKDLHIETLYFVDFFFIFLCLSSQEQIFHLSNIE